MPSGPVFTTSAGGDIGGANANRGLRTKGPVYAGQVADGVGLVAFDGSAAVPIYSFERRPDMGLYPHSVSTASAEFRGTVAGASLVALSTAGFQVGTTSLESTAGIAKALYITQANGAIFTSSGANGEFAPSAFNVGAAVVYDASRKKLCVYSSIHQSWVATAPMTSS